MRRGLLLSLCLSALPLGCTVDAQAPDGEGAGGQAEQAVEQGIPAVAPFSQTTVGIEGNTFCTGVVVASRWILSAAHCKLTTAHTVHFYSGSTENGVVIGIDKVVLPAGVDPSTDDFDAAPDGHMADLALLHLKANIPSSARIALLPTAGVDQHTVAGNAATTVGTGKHDGVIAPGTQMKMRTMKILSVDPSSSGSDGVMWGSEDANDPGDSGGPLYVSTPSGPKVVGVLRGRWWRTASAAFRSRYSTVRDSVTWIKNTINGVPPTSTLLEVTYEACGSGTVVFTTAIGPNPSLPLGATNKVNFMVPNGDVHWTCDGTPERTGCPDGTNQVVAYRADGRRFVVECRMLQ